jgi:AcrR family transcriptional regulator
VQVIRRVGLANTTTREIAQAAGLSEAALYKYFDDKMDLFLCVLRERLPDLFGVLSDLPNQVGKRSVRANLESVAEVAVDFFQESAPFLASLFSRPELLARYQEHMRSTGAGPSRARDLLAEYLKAEQQAARVAPQANAEVAAALLIGACWQRAFSARFAGLPPNRQEDQRFIKEVVRLLMRALEARPKGLGVRPGALP